jgi:hypothetical protein
LLLSRKKSNEGSMEICNDDEQYIMSGHLRASLAAIAEIMLQCLSNNAPDLLTHTSLSLSLSLSLALISVTPSFLAILTHLCVQLLLISVTPSYLLWTLKNPLVLVKCSLSIH